MIREKEREKKEAGAVSMPFCFQRRDRRRERRFPTENERRADEGRDEKYLRSKVV